MSLLLCLACDMLCIDLARVCGVARASGSVTVFAWLVRSVGTGSRRPRVLAIGINTPSQCARAGLENGVVCRYLGRMR